MKLLIITCVKEYQQQVIDILHQSGVAAFSMTDITGYKNGYSDSLLDGWFATEHEAFDSLMFFSFCPADKAVNARKNMDEFNATKNGDFPIRVFQMAVETTNQL